MKTSLPTNSTQDVCLSFTFEEHVSYFELVLDEGDNCSKGWRIVSHQVPAIVSSL